MKKVNSSFICKKFYQQWFKTIQNWFVAAISIYPPTPNYQPTLLYFPKTCSVNIPNLALHSYLVLVQDGLLDEFLVNIQETQFINEVLCLDQLALLCHLLNEVQVILCFCNLWFLLPSLWFLWLKISGGDRGDSNAFIFWNQWSFHR